MNLGPLLEEQMRIQENAIALWRRWMIGLIAGGLVVMAAAGLCQRLGWLGLNAMGITGTGGALIGLLATFPYRETIPRRERLATYGFLVDRFRHYDSLPDAERQYLQTMAAEAARETLKR